MKSSLYLILLIVVYAAVLAFTINITSNPYVRFVVSTIGVGICLLIVLKVFNKK